MGNRAVISFNENPSAPSIYVHWNGGRASIEAFLQATRDTGYAPSDSEQQDIEQIARCIRLFFARNGECMSIYTQPVASADTDNWDNGWYLIGRQTLEIKRRKFVRRGEETNAGKTEAIRAQIHHLATKPACRYEHLWEAA